MELENSIFRELPEHQCEGSTVRNRKRAVRKCWRRWQQCGCLGKGLRFSLSLQSLAKGEIRSHWTSLSRSKSKWYTFWNIIWLLSRNVLLLNNSWTEEFGWEHNLNDCGKLDLEWWDQGEKWRDTKHSLEVKKKKKSRLCIGYGGREKQKYESDT